jgi:hypothetical protein
MRRISCATTAKKCVRFNGQLEVERMHEIRRIDRVRGRLGAQLAGRNLPQLGVDEWQHAVERIAVAARPSPQQGSDISRRSRCIRVHGPPGPRSNPIALSSALNRGSSRTRS